MNLIRLDFSLALHANRSGWHVSLRSMLFVLRSFGSSRLEIWHKDLIVHVGDLGHVTTREETYDHIQYDFVLNQIYPCILYVNTACYRHGTVLDPDILFICMTLYKTRSLRFLHLNDTYMTSITRIVGVVVTSHEYVASLSRDQSPQPPPSLTILSQLPVRCCHVSSYVSVATWPFLNISLLVLTRC